MEVIGKVSAALCQTPQKTKHSISKCGVNINSRVQSGRFGADSKVDSSADSRRESNDRIGTRFRRHEPARELVH